MFRSSVTTVEDGQRGKEYMWVRVEVQLQVIIVIAPQIEDYHFSSMPAYVIKLQNHQTDG